MTAFTNRIAAAPITWGVDPARPYLISRERYVEEFKSLGLTATELGPDGFLPADPDELDAYLAAEAIRVIGGWVPIPLAFQGLYDEHVTYLRRAASQFERAGGEVLVLGPVWDDLGYERRGVLSTDDWTTFFRNLADVQDIARDHGLVVALHQHIGTVIENQSELDRLLDNSDVKICVDTGHMVTAGIDPVAVVAKDPSRVAHAHLKDITLEQASLVRSGENSFDVAVKDGLFRPLGTGDVDIPAVITTLESAGYQGWYAIEQDCILTEVPAVGEGPVRDARISYEYLVDLAEARSL